MGKIIEIIIKIFKSFIIPKPTYFSDPTEDDIKIEILVPEEKKVDIVIDKKIRTKYRRGWIKKLRKDPAIEIVLHGTGGGQTIHGFLKWMWDGQRAKNYYRGISLFHYIIGLDGEIVEIIDPEYWVYHSHSSIYDKKTIGIELMNSSKSNRNPYTAKQYNSLFDLIFGHLIPLYPTLNRISNHRYNIIIHNKGRSLKQCPGIGFDWNKLDMKTKELGYTFKKDGTLIYDMREK